MAAAVACWVVAEPRWSRCSPCGKVEPAVASRILRDCKMRRCSSSTVAIYHVRTRCVSGRESGGAAWVTQRGQCTAVKCGVACVVFRVPRCRERCHRCAVVRATLYHIEMCTAPVRSRPCNHGRVSGLFGVCDSAASRLPPRDENLRAAREPLVMRGRESKRVVIQKKGRDSNKRVVIQMN